MDPLDPTVTDEPKVDYKKLVDLLDGSDVVTNADPFDCPVCLMTVPAGVGVTLRECLHNFCRYYSSRLILIEILNELICTGALGIVWLT
jgi:hypothetical protein